MSWRSLNMWVGRYLMDGHDMICVIASVLMGLLFRADSEGSVLNV